MSELERRVDLAAPPEVARLEPWKASHVRASPIASVQAAPRLDGKRVVLAVLEVHDLVRDALARVLPNAGAEVILLGVEHARSTASCAPPSRRTPTRSCSASTTATRWPSASASPRAPATSSGAGTIYMGGILNQDTGEACRSTPDRRSSALGVRCVDNVDELLGLLAEADHIGSLAALCYVPDPCDSERCSSTATSATIRRSSSTWRKHSKVRGSTAVLTNDHVVGAHPDRQRPGEKVHTYDVPCHEPLVFLTFLGAVTTRLELATSIVISTQRQTVLLAKQAAELDLLTGGRLRLGVGIGRNWMEYEALEQDFSNRGTPHRGAGRRPAPAVDQRAGHVRRQLAPPRPHRHEPAARRSGRSRSGWARSSATSSRGCWNAPVGSPTAGCRSSHPANSLPARSNGSAATPPRQDAIRRRWGSSAACASPRRRRSADVDRHRRRVSRPRRHASAGVHHGRWISDARRAPRRLDPLARRRRSSRPGMNRGVLPR